MSKTNDTSKLGHGTFEDHTLDDTELNAVTGGTPKLYEAACKGTHLPEVVIELWRAGGDSPATRFPPLR